MTPTAAGFPAREDADAGDLTGPSSLSAETVADPRLGSRRRPDAALLRMLAYAEYAVLYVVALLLLALGSAVLARSISELLRSEASWPERFVVVLEELLLVLIILEIFVTVLTHLQGGRLQLEPFITVAVIAVVRHILSIVVRLAIPGAPVQSRFGLTELAANAGVAFLLVAALALNRWSQRRHSA
jgi:uncharacterized membrane protein (DUF373 family)